MSNHTFAAVKQAKKMIENLDRWLDKAVAHAKAKSFEPNVFAESRLAPDQYSLVRQIQAACDNAKFMAYRLAGKEPPKQEDNEKTVDELKARIAATVKLIDALSESDFEGASTRAITLPFLEGKPMTGDEYLFEFVSPNFYFHVATAYAILRHNGVDLGKRDFIGALSALQR